MKKFLSLFILAGLALSLTGCGESEQLSATCSKSETDGSKVTFVMDATDDIIDNIKMEYIMTPEALGVSDQVSAMNELDETTLQTIKDNYIKALGLESYTYDGMELGVDFTENMIMTVDADLEVADKDILKKVGFDFGDEEKYSLKVSIEEMEAEGYTCE